IGSPPQNLPASWSRSRHSVVLASRSSASASGALSAKRSRAPSGGGWLRTSWVAAGALQASVGMGVLVVGDGAQAEDDELVDEDVGVALRGDGGERADERLAERTDERGAGEVRVLVGKLAARDPVGEDRGEVRRVGAAEHEALGLDGRIDRLG